MQILGLPFLRRFAGLAPLVLRVALGVIMAAHGYQKLTNGPTQGFAGMLGGMGMPAPEALAWFVTLVELVGGLALVVGLLTRIAAILNTGVMLVVIFMVKLGNGLLGGPGASGFELELAIAAGMIALALTGPGWLSVDSMLGIEPEG